MLRILSSLALAAAIAATPMMFSADAAKAAPKKAYKTCKHKTQSGKIKSWRCGADQPCCSAEMINYYTCGSKTLGCL